MLRVSEPLVPMIVSVKFPFGVDGLIVWTVSVAVPPPVTETGENVSGVFAGPPATLNVTVPENPPVGETVTV